MTKHMKFFKQDGINKARNRNLSKGMCALCQPARRMALSALSAAKLILLVVCHFRW